MVEAALGRSEPSPRFASNGIHTKSGADNLKGNGLEKGPDASRVPVLAKFRSEEEAKTRVSQTLKHLLWR